jgi:hypothetical protein
MDQNTPVERPGPGGPPIFSAQPAPRHLAAAAPTADAADLAGASPWRAWCYLVLLSWQRQARARQMVWIAVGLLAFAVAVVAVLTAADFWRLPQLRTRVDRAQVTLGVVFHDPGGLALTAAFHGAAREVLRLDESAFLLFSRWVVFSIFLSFLLPVLSLSFATEALGGDRESNSLIWLLTRPLPRPAIYLAKFVALLPWSVGLNLGGFALLCLVGGPAGRTALQLYWPAVTWATLAFSSLFYLLGACFRRPAVIAIVYSFFLETILGNMPGYLKRISIGFYTRCMMFEAAQGYGVEPEKPSVYLPVEGGTALVMLVGVTVVLLALGALLFARSQYHEVV